MGIEKKITEMLVTASCGDQKQICKVLYQIGTYSAATLNRIVMNQKPYRDAYANTSNASVITLESLKAYFSE